VRLRRPQRRQQGLHVCQESFAVRGKRVGLVDCHVPHVRKGKKTLLSQKGKAPWGSDDDVHSRVKRLPVLGLLAAAQDADGSKLYDVSQSFCHSKNLYG